jgi:hypothetical protein
MSARKRGGWFPWDYATVLGPVPFWYVLSIVQIGHQSMGNLIEMVIVAVFVPLVISLRVFVLDRFWGRSERNSLFVLVLSFLFVVVIRLLMPELPE